MTCFFNFGAISISVNIPKKNRIFVLNFQAQFIIIINKRKEFWLAIQENQWQIDFSFYILSFVNKQTKCKQNKSFYSIIFTEKKKRKISHIFVKQGTLASLKWAKIIMLTAFAFTTYREISSSVFSWRATKQSTKIFLERKKNSSNQSTTLIAEPEF